MLDDVLKPFQAALREQLADPTLPLTTVVGSIDALVERARSVGLRAEHVVILVKREVESAVSGTGADAPILDRLRQSLVTSAIKAYYVQ